VRGGPAEDRGAVLGPCDDDEQLVGEGVIAVPLPVDDRRPAALVVGPTVVVATENDSVYAFDRSYRQVWKRTLGSPSPAEERQCGDIDPLGITGTPAYDPSTGSVFVVAETRGGHHTLWAINAATGLDARLREFRVNAVTGGQDALGEVSVVVELVMLGIFCFGHKERLFSQLFIFGIAVTLHAVARGTAVLAHLEPNRDGHWTMTWSNAGHPPPIVIEPDGSARLLADHDHLFGFSAFQHLPRHDHQVDLQPGCTLFLYSDGLVERRGHDLDRGIDHLLDLLKANRHLTSTEIVDITVGKLASDSTDDVVAFAIQIPPVGA